MIKLILVGNIVPKPRPIVTKQGTFMPKRYTIWKTNAIIDFRTQYKASPLAKVESITIKLIGKHSRRGDCDNISGAVLDALVQAEILANDNLMVVPMLSIELQYNAKADPMTKIIIQLCNN